MITVLLAALEYGGYVSLVKLIIYVVLFFTWPPLVSWVNTDAQEVKTRVEFWTCIILATGVGTLVILLMAPIFLIGLLLYLIAVGATSIAYVMHRNSKVADFERVLTASHIKSIFVNENKKIATASRGFTFITANKNEAPLPKAKTPEAFGFTAAVEIFDDAIWRRANDIVFQPGTKNYSVIYSVDGMPIKQPEKAREEIEYFIQYLKQLADLDVNERRKPQTGILRTSKDNEIEWEVTTAGSTAGEQVRIKRLEESTLIKLEDIGLAPKQIELLRPVGQIDRGLFIISGPPKSGVTTTFYAMLRNHDPFMNDINTLEKKPAAKLSNITQHTFKLSDTGTTSYSRKLQHLLRMGADVMGVADCGDKECAQLVCAAAKNGKVVHVTLETTGAVQALGKWLKLVPDKNIAVDTLVGIINQRLVRKLCEKCKQAYQPNPDLLRKFNMPADKIKLLYRTGEVEYDRRGKPRLCEECQGTGFSGRTGVFEVIILSDKLKEALKKAKTLQEIASLFRRAGMHYMQEMSIQKVATGLTSIHEVIRVLSPAKKPAKREK